MSSVELVILTPFLLALLLVLVGLYRVSQGRSLVDAASASASRSASLAPTPAQAVVQARLSAAATLAGAGRACPRFRLILDTSAFRPGGQVTATVHCTSDLSDLAAARLPLSWDLTSTSTSPLETYRTLGTSP